MKKAILLLGLTLTLSSAFAKDIREVLLSSTLAPFGLSTQGLETLTVSVLIPIDTTIKRTQDRGVAGKEQLRDELVLLHDDIQSGEVKTIEQVRQPGLKELFQEIASSEEEMKGINTLLKEGSELQKIATAVNLSLIVE